MQTTLRVAETSIATTTAALHDAEMRANAAERELVEARVGFEASLRTAAEDKATVLAAAMAEKEAALAEAAAQMNELLAIAEEDKEAAIASAEAAKMAALEDAAASSASALAAAAKELTAAQEASVDKARFAVRREVSQPWLEPPSSKIAFTLLTLCS